MRCEVEETGEGAGEQSAIDGEVAIMFAGPEEAERDGFGQGNPAEGRELLRSDPGRQTAGRREGTRECQGRMRPAREELGLVVT